MDKGISSRTGHAPLRALLLSALFCSHASCRAHLALPLYQVLCAGWKVVAEPAGQHAVSAYVYSTFRQSWPGKKTRSNFAVQIKAFGKFSYKMPTSANGKIASLCFLPTNQNAKHFICLLWWDQSGRSHSPRLRHGRCFPSESTHLFEKTKLCCL